MRLLLPLALFPLLPVFGAAKGTPPASAGKYRVLAQGVSVTELVVPATVPLDKATDIQVHPKGLFFLLAGGKIVSPLDGKSLIPPPSDNVDSFVFHPSNGILTTHQGKLGYVGDKGVVDKIPLAGPGMRLTGAGPETVTIYGTSVDGVHSVYLYKFNGTFRRAVDAPGPISAAVGDGRRIVFASKGGIFELLTAGYPISRVYLPGQEITSVEMAPGDSLLFTTKKGIYLTAGKFVLPVLSGLDCRVRTGPEATFLAVCPSARKLLRLRFDWTAIHRTASAQTAPSDSPDIEARERRIAWGREAVAQNPKAAKPHCELATDLAAFGRSDEAFAESLECYRRLDEGPERDAELGRMVQLAGVRDLPAADVELLRKGEAALKEKDHSAAVKALKQVIDDAPWFVPAWEALGLVYADDDDPKRANRIVATHERMLPGDRGKYFRDRVRWMLAIRDKHGS